MDYVLAYDDPLDDALDVFSLLLSRRLQQVCNGTTTDASSNSFIVDSPTEIAIIVVP